MEGADVGRGDGTGHDRRRNRDVSRAPRLGQAGRGSDLCGNATDVRRYRGARGNAEYRDVLAAGRYLATRPDVDSTRIGIWGLSYGGILTAQALARNSDLFAAGVDMAGVHLWGSSLDTSDVSYQSSAIAAI